MNFKVGDKVQCIEDFQDGDWLGMIGTVVVFSPGGSPGVDFKQQSRTGRGHDLNGSIKTETGWWFHGNNIRRYLKKIEKPKQFEFQF